MQQDPNAMPAPQMALGGAALDAALAKLTEGQRAMYDGIVAGGASPDAAMAIVSVTAKESGGDFTSTERSPLILQTNVLEKFSQLLAT